jgi:hypothetical protein
VRDDAADESERVPQCVCDNNRGCVVCGLVCSGVKSTNRWCFGLIYSESRTGLHRETLTPPPQPKRRWRRRWYERNEKKNHTIKTVLRVAGVQRSRSSGCRVWPRTRIIFLHERWKLEIPDAVECDYYSIIYAHTHRATHLM